MLIAPAPRAASAGRVSTLDSRRENDPTDSSGATAVERGRTASLALSPEEFKALGHELVDSLADLIAGIPEGPVTPGHSPTHLRRTLDSDRPLPEEGEDPAQILRHATHLLRDHSLYNAHPRFFGYITASPSPLGILGDFLASAINANAGAWVLSPMATEIEAQTVRWIAELLGYPTEGDGLLVSGGSMANQVAFWAARRQKTPWDVRKEGLGGDRPPLRAYASQETHTWIQKAADLSGLGADAVRWIPTDAQQRIDLPALARAVARDRAEGDIPFLVVGTAGTVSTGAVDPLPALADYCAEQGLWFHVDGAYGGFAAAAPGAPADLLGMSRADSVAVDPHKWLYAPLEAGCVLTRQPDALTKTFSYHPPYYHFGVEAKNYLDSGPQNSRGFKALKVWLALRQAGRAGYRTMIGDDMALARRLYERVDAHPDYDAVTQNLSITTFRYVPPDLRGKAHDPEVQESIDHLNREIQTRLETSGEAFVSGAVVDGRYVLRACIVNFNTRMEDVDALPDIISRTATVVRGAAP